MDFDNITDDEIAVARFKCDESLLYFTRWWFRILRGSKFIVNWHHDDICTQLEKVQNYELEYLGINIPPRFSKTELAAVNFIARGIGMNPCGNYLYITASDELRSETSIRIRDIVSHPVFNRMYGVELKPDQTGKNLWRTKQGGGLKTATIFGQITGFGAGQMVQHNKELEDFIREFEGCIVLDDLNKTDDAEVLNAINSKVLRVLSNTVLSRTNSDDTPIINIQQRAGTEDATAYFNNLYEGNKKAVNLVYPVIYKGKSLWEWKMPMKKIEERRTNPLTAHTFETQYMQNPRPSEGLVYPNKFQTYKTLPVEPINETETKIQGWCMMAIDSADKGTDHFSAPIVQVIGNRVYLKDVIFDTNELITQEPTVKAKVDENDTTLVVIETNHAGNYFSGRVRALIPNVDVFGQWSSTNKMARILSMSGLLNRYLYVPENPSTEMQQFLKECYDLLKTSKNKDDAPDSLSLLFAHLEKHYQIFS